MLMSLFSLFCFNCKMPKPRVEIKRNGSMAKVTQLCSTCGPRRAFQWNSQPHMLGKYPAGNLMIRFGILMSGVNISKTIMLFKHMGLCSISIRTYFIFPSVLLHWEKYRRALVEKIKRVKNATWCDGHFDSMGHNAKYGVYTMFCNTISKIVHFDLRQVNWSFSDYILF